MKSCMENMHTDFGLNLFEGWIFSGFLCALVSIVLICRIPALLNPLTPKILLVILLTVCQTILIMLVWRIWYHIN